MLMPSPRRHWRRRHDRTPVRTPAGHGGRRAPLKISFGLAMGFPPGFALMEWTRTPPADDPERDLVPWRLNGPELQRLKRH